MTSQMSPFRPFSITKIVKCHPKDRLAHLVKLDSYPVLMISDGETVTCMLIADDEGYPVWVNLNGDDCRIAV